jgi:hypothetical protein
MPGLTKPQAPFAGTIGGQMSAGSATSAEVLCD